MTAPRFSLRIEGARPGADLDRSAAGLAGMLKISEARARALLRERAAPLGHGLDAAKARQIAAALEAIGLVCRLLPEGPAGGDAPQAAAASGPAPAPAPTGDARPPPVRPSRQPRPPGPSDRPPASEGPGRDPPSAAETFARPTPGLVLETANVRCPGCGAEQPPGELCSACGIAMDKYRQGEAWRPRPAPAAPAQADARRETGMDPVLHRRLMHGSQAVLAASLLVVAWALWEKDRLPPPDFYDLARLTEPEQSPTETAPFRVEQGGVVYLVEPVYDYRLNGVLVSLHDTDALDDIYHRQDWKDFLNLRDLCVVWGGNAASGVMRGLAVHNTTWTCWIAWDSPEAARDFSMHELSNNHVLSDRPEVRRAIRAARVGDQIAFAGMLAHYSHDGGFTRGTSTVRTDTGNGACETVYVTDFEIVRRANPGWRRAFAVFSALAGAALLAIVALAATRVRP